LLLVRQHTATPVPEKARLTKTEDDRENEIQLEVRRPSRRGPWLFLSLTAAAAVSLYFLLNSRTTPGDVVDLTGGRGRPEITAAETALRNLAGRRLEFELEPTEKPSGRRSVACEPGRLVRLVTNAPVRVFYDNGARRAEQTLYPRQPYCFRLDENGLVRIYPGSHMLEDAADLAPYVPPPPPVVRGMLELAGVGPDDVVYDLGCGDGRLVIQAASLFGARGVGIEIDPLLVEACRENAAAAGVSGRVRFLSMDATRAGLTEATVVTVYLLPESLELLKPVFERDLRDGARIVSHDYRIPGWDGKVAAVETVPDETGRSHKIFLYRFERAK
jgi:SAM-dependent methyltransferase